MVHGRLSKIDGYRDGNLLYTIWFSRDVNQKRIKVYKTVIKSVNGQTRIDELSQDSEDSDYGLRFDNIVIQVFLDPNLVLDGKQELMYRLKSIQYYHAPYYLAGEISGSISMNYLNGLNEKLAIWEDEAFDIRQKGLSSNDEREISNLEAHLNSIVLEIKELELSHFAYDGIIPGVNGINSIQVIYETIEFWKNELNNRINQLFGAGNENSTKQTN